MHDDSDLGASRTSRTLDDVWSDEHAYLRALASRMLRDAAEAEDVVQEAFGRLMRVGLDGIGDPRAWLTVVVRRICLNRLSSAYNRRESAAGAAPPEGPQPVVTQPAPGDPADRVTLDDQVSGALAVVLGELSPAERTSFVLHDIFDFSYSEIGDLVGRTEVNCRQLASRARRAIRALAPSSSSIVSPSPSAGEHRLVVERFVVACMSGDVAALIEVLDPDVVGEAMAPDGRRLGGGRGATAVVRQIMRYVGPETGTQLAAVAGESGIDVVAVAPDGSRGVISVQVAAGRIHHIRSQQLSC